MAMLINQSGRSFSAPVTSKPLGDEIGMKGIDIALISDSSTGESFGFRHSIIYDGVYLWLSSLTKGQPLTRVNPVTGAYTQFLFNNGVNGNAGLDEDKAATQSGAFDGTYVWLMPSYGHLTRVDPLTGTMTGYARLQDENGNDVDMSNILIAATVYDGKFIWMIGGNKLYRFDTKQMTFTHVLDMVVSVNVMVYADSALWTMYFKNNEQWLRKLSLPSLETKEYSLGEGSAHSYLPLACDGMHIWVMPFGGKDVRRFNMQTEEWTAFSMQEGVNGNTNMGNIDSAEILFLYSIYDGRYIWMTPYDSDRLMRLDTRTGSMRGYELQGDNLGNWPDSTIRSRSFDITFDGANIWLCPYCADKLLKVSPASLDGLNIYERYIDPEGAELKPEKATPVNRGETFTAIAPIIPSYSCVGYRLDGGAIQAGAVATINNVQADHTITFVYRKEDAPEPGVRKGCAKVKIEIMACSNNSLIKDVSKLIQESECDCIYNCCCDD